MFVVSVILALIAAGLYIASRVVPKTRVKEVRNSRTYDLDSVEEPRSLSKWLFWSSIGTAALALIALLLSSYYTQDEGTVHVQRDITGKIVGQTSESGFHPKAPWVYTVEYNVRNQPVAFGGTAENYSQANGAGFSFDAPQVTVQDKDKVSHDVDSNILYSLVSGKVTDIAKSFADEAAFKNDYVFPTIRDVIRDAANDFTTEQMLSDRSSYREKIMEELEKRFEGSDLGVQLSEFTLQEVRSPGEVKAAYDAAAAAEINVSTQTNQALAEVEKAKGEANAQRERANGEADANRTIAASLTPEVLQKLMIDAYDEGTVYVTDGNTDLLLQR